MVERWGKGDHSIFTPSHMWSYLLFFYCFIKKKKKKRTRTLLAKDKFAMSSYLPPRTWGFVHIIYILLRQQKNRLFSWAVGHISSASASAAQRGPHDCGSLFALKGGNHNWFISLCWVFRRNLGRLNDQASQREAACCTLATFRDVSISEPAGQKGPELKQCHRHFRYSSNLAH